MLQVKFDQAKVIYDGGHWLSVKLCGDPIPAKRFVAEMGDKPQTAQLKPYRERRSLDANAYLWVLLGELAAKVRLPREDIYRRIIRDLGGNSYTVPVRDDAVDHFIAIWQDRGLGWVCDTIPSKLSGYTNIICYYGSSQYDTQQMSRMIESVLEECHVQGIDTRSPQEVSLMLEAWDR